MINKEKYDLKLNILKHDNRDVEQVSVVNDTLMINNERFFSVGRTGEGLIMWGDSRTLALNDGSLELLLGIFKDMQAEADKEEG